MKIKTILAVLAVAASPLTAFASGGADIKYVGTVVTGPQVVGVTMSGVKKSV